MLSAVGIGAKSEIERSKSPDLLNFLITKNIPVKIKRMSVI